MLSYRNKAERTGMAHSRLCQELAIAPAFFGECFAVPCCAARLTGGQGILSARGWPAEAESKPDELSAAQRKLLQEAAICAVPGCVRAWGWLIWG